jgi:hypothetical protein
MVSKTVVLQFTQERGQLEMLVTTGHPLHKLSLFLAAKHVHTHKASMAISMVKLVWKMVQLPLQAA